MTNSSSNANSFALASRFLNALENLNKSLDLNHVTANYGDLNLSQLRILQAVHSAPGIRADAVIEHIEIETDAAARLILAMEQTGLLSLDRSAPDLSPSISLGAQGRRMSFQVKATLLSILAEMIGKLPESRQLETVEALEQLTKLHEG